MWIRLSDIDCHDVATLARRLAPFGITIGGRTDAPCVAYRMARSDDIVKEVGEVLRFADGRVAVVARWDATDQEVIALLQAAEIGYRTEPSLEAGWVYRRGSRAGWWQHTLLVPVGAGDPFQWAFRKSGVAIDPVLRIADAFTSPLPLPVPTRTVVSPDHGQSATSADPMT